METVNPVDILLVEDNDDDILLIRQAFAEAKFVNVFHVVPDGEAAMNYLRRRPPYQDAPPPGLVLLDINMPRKDGFETLQEIKADSSLRHLPIIMLTSSSREEDIVRSYWEGACSFITKPVDFPQLVRVLNNFALYWALVARLPPGAPARGAAHPPGPPGA